MFKIECFSNKLARNVLVLYGVGILEMSFETVPTVCSAGGILSVLAGKLGNAQYYGAFGRRREEWRRLAGTCTMRNYILHQCADMQEIAKRIVINLYNINN